MDDYTCLHGMDVEKELTDILVAEIEKERIELDRIVSNMIIEEDDRIIIASMIDDIESKHKQNKEKLCMNGSKK